MPKITIKQIKHENKISQRTGKSFESCSILTTDQNGQETWLSGFGGDITHTWKAGHIVDVNITKKDNGYYNFELNPNSVASPDETIELLKKIDRKLDLLLGNKPVDNINNTFEPVFPATDEPNDEINISDIPFN
jgi:hypothetical protein